MAEMSSESGITMEVYIDLPGMQLYTGNFIVDAKGKGGAHYHKRQAACFETQFFPDAIHKENLCRAGMQEGRNLRNNNDVQVYITTDKPKRCHGHKIHDTFFENILL